MKKRLLSCLAFTLALAASAQIELFKEINTVGTDSNPNYVYVTNDGKKAYFQASNGTDGSELWVSDGTVAGTNMLIDLDGTTSNSYPRAFVEFNNTMYFWNNGASAMWKTDGTALGTEVATELAGQYFEGSIEFNGALYYIDKNAGVTNGDIFRFDGTTASVSGYDKSNGDMYVSEMFLFNDKIFCYARTSTEQSTIGNELYVFDPSNDTFQLFKEFASGASAGYVSNFIEYNGQMYFSAANDTDTSVDALWVSDGTALNTVKVTATQDFAVKGEVFTWNNLIYFLADDSNAIENIFSYNPSTQAVKQLTWFTVDHDANSYTEIDGYLYYRGETENTRTYSTSDARLFRINPDGETIEQVDPDNKLDIDWFVKVVDPNDNNIILMRGDDDGDTIVYGTELFWVNPAAITYSQVLSTAKPLSEVARVYPNPASDYLMMPNKLMNAPYSIYDITGRAVKSGVISSERLDFNLNTGLYILKVEVDAASYTQKIMVRK
ncbi:T9SS type A sorting domain-containing protein [Aestuariibaculum lutulentum]|uniref:T9SS type A sorting domain-containing protein n=1 Tax=Aestuariibaculum lutulentum TaxID=2920935 RepID=A0ABS9RPJ8_9FLAO|nr:T9SS type A sorting domain-containing protein [Aestuariibaculum lutulentum]MCH4554112.1 T9SS type A sorting domain-containing protein [Aestuariibaculum lutulentum]